MLNMVRNLTYAGNIEKRDQIDILCWDFEKSAGERLIES